MATINDGMFDFINDDIPIQLPMHKLKPYGYLGCGGYRLVYKYRHHCMFKHGNPKRMRKAK